MSEYTSEDYAFVIRMLHHRKELTKEEVDAWLKVPEHLDLLEEMAAIQSVAGNFQAEDPAESYRYFRRRISRWRKFRLAVCIAASVMICLGFWQFFFQDADRETVVPTVVRACIEPGKTKARLILPDGKVVDLALGKQEIRVSENGVIRNDSLEGLKYQIGETDIGKEDYHTLQVPLGGFYKLELSDGTKVWLNAGSELRYPAQFSGAERNVFLKGEGYFEVAKHEQKPFQVVMQQAKVTVLGTSFNISAYPEEKEVFATLVNGAVRFRSEKKNREVVLKPGEQGVLECESGKTTVSKVETEQYTAWINGRFVFRDISLEAIMRQLERWYDFEVFWLNPDVRSYEFRGVIQRDSRIEDVFRAIELATDVKFKIKGKQVIIVRK